MYLVNLVIPVADTVSCVEEKETNCTVLLKAKNSFLNLSTCPTIFWQSPNAPLSLIYLFHHLSLSLSLSLSPLCHFLSLSLSFSVSFL